MGTQYHQNDMKTCGFSMIFIFANVLIFYDIFNSYEFQEKLNIEYQLGRKAKSEDFHDDLRGSQGWNIEYQLGPSAKVDVCYGSREGEGRQSAKGDMKQSSSPPDPQSKKDMET